MTQNNLPLTDRKTPQTKQGSTRKIVPCILPIRVPGIVIVLIIASCLIPRPAGAAAPVPLRLIVTATAQEAQEILADVRGGRSFALLAKERSGHKSSERYGELDRTGIDLLPAPLRAAIPLLREGDTSSVIRLDKDHYALLQYIDFRHYRIGAAAFRAADFSTAERHLLRHVRENPDAIRARIMLGEIYEQQGLVEQALAVYHDVLAYEPGHSTAAARARVLSLKIVPDAAGPTERPAPPAAPENRKRTGGDHTAEVAGPGTAEVRPYSRTEGTGVPLRIIMTGSEKKAEDVLAELQRGKPFFFLAHDNSIDRKSAEAYGDLGLVDPLTLHPAIREALATLRPGGVSGVIRLENESYGIIQVKDTGHFAEAEKYFSAGNHRDAEEHLQKHLSLNPEDADARLMLASLYEMQREYTKAGDAYYQAMVFKPGAAGPYERLGKMYLARHDYARAEEIFARGLRLTSSRRLFEKLMEIVTISLIGTVR